MGEYKITGEDVGSLLFNIHHHHPTNEKIFFYEEDLLPILKELGLPQPIWGKAISLEQFKNRKQS